MWSIPAPPPAEDFEASLKWATAVTIKIARVTLQDAKGYVEGVSQPVVDAVLKKLLPRLQVMLHSVAPIV